MPWHIGKHPKCSGVAVVKDSDGSLAGCHDSEAAATRQLAALYAKEGTMSDRARTGVEAVDNFDRPTPSREVQYRSYSGPQLEVRSVDDDGDGRTVFGIAVPYDAPVRINDRLVERFARGAFNHQLADPGRVKFARNHMSLGGDLIGTATLLRDDPAGLYVELRVANTEKGNETLELIRARALDQLSIAFNERHNRRVGGVVERVKANLREVAVVLEGAYGELATAVGVRSRQPYPSDDDPDLDALREAAADVLQQGLPPLPDYDVEIRAAELGMSWRR